MNITATERRDIADMVGMSEQYLYQCLTGRRDMDPRDAVRLERESRGRVMRWAVRVRDWHLIWPEMVGAEGAPAPGESPSTPAQAV